MPYPAGHRAVTREKIVEVSAAEPEPSVVELALLLACPGDALEH